jgi:hypothetical protein
MPRIGATLILFRHEAVPGLAAALRNEAPDTRRFAATTLGAVGASAAGVVEDLKRRERDDPDRDVRDTARRARQQIEHQAYQARVAALVGGSGGPLPALAHVAALPAEAPAPPPKEAGGPLILPAPVVGENVPEVGWLRAIPLGVKLLFVLGGAVAAFLAWLARKNAQLRARNKPGAPDDAEQGPEPPGLL